MLLGTVYIVHGKSKQGHPGISWPLVKFALRSMVLCLRTLYSVLHKGSRGLGRPNYSMEKVIACQPDRPEWRRPASVQHAQHH